MVVPVRGAGRRGPGPPLDRGEDGRAHPDEDDAEEDEEERPGDGMAAADRRVHDRELADERTERRGAGDREEADEEEAPRDREAGDRAGDLVDVLAPVGAVDVPGRQEQDPLRQAVVDRVEEGAEDADPAEADAEDEDPDVLDARVGEHPLDVPLAHDEDGRERDREQAHEDEELAGEGPLARRVHDAVDAQEREEGAVRHAAREERPDDAGGLAVGVGLPGVEGGEPHLRAVADEEQDERRAEPRPREGPRPGEEVVEEERGLAAAEVRRVGEEERAEEREGDADRPDHQVLPGRLERPGGPVEVEERRRREGRRLHRHPEEAEVLGEGEEGGHREEDEEAGAEDPVVAVGAQREVAGGVEGDEEEEDADRPEDDRRERVESEPEAAPRADVPEDEAGEERGVQEPRDRHDEGPRAGRRDERGDDGAEEREEDEADFHSCPLSVSPSAPRGGPCRATRTPAGCG